VVLLQSPQVLPALATPTTDKSVAAFMLKMSCLRLCYSASVNKGSERLEP
jgi:hypothetical protein